MNNTTTDNANINTKNVKNILISTKNSNLTAISKISSQTSTILVRYNISLFDTSVKGNVLANSAIKNDIPITSLSNQIFQMTKYGSVILKFGNGHGPKLLISVGIHGNEPQANIAAMKYIEYLKNKSFQRNNLYNTIRYSQRYCT